MGPDLVVVVVVGGDDIAVVCDGSGIVIVVVVGCGGILLHKLAFIYRNIHQKNFLFYPSQTE